MQISVYRTKWGAGGNLPKRLNKFGQTRIFRAPEINYLGKIKNFGRRQRTILEN